MAKRLSTREFSEMTGLPVSAVSRMVREGKIDGIKESGKWLIDPDGLKAKEVEALSRKTNSQRTTQGAGQVPRAPKAPGKEGAKHVPKPAGKTYSVSEFSDLTYLTEKGVEDFLKTGRLQGVKDDRGIWHLSHENLKNPSIRHLIR
jgi:DNA-binding Lrp family transcriptional regulator